MRRIKYLSIACVLFGATFMSTAVLAESTTGEQSEPEQMVSAEMPMWVNDTLNAEIMVLTKQKDIVELRSEIMRIKKEMADMDKKPEPVRRTFDMQQQNHGQAHLGFRPGEQGQGITGGMGNSVPYQMVGDMPMQQLQLVAPVPPEAQRQNEPDKTMVELPKITKIAGSKGNLQAVLIYEDGGSFTALEGDNLPSGGKVVSIGIRGVVVKVGKDTTKPLMFSREFSGRVTPAPVDPLAMESYVPSPQPPIDSVDLNQDVGISLY